MEQNNSIRHTMGLILVASAAACVAAGVVLGFMWNRSGLLVLGSIAAALFALPGIWCLIGEEEAGDKAGRSAALFKERTFAGRKPIRAKILGVTRNLRSQGEETTYYIICRYTDPDSGVTEDFTSRELKAYPGKEVIGKEVTITFDRNGYTVDIEPVLPPELRL